jgi:hypothetical protein
LGAVRWTWSQGLALRLRQGGCRGVLGGYTGWQGKRGHTP